MSQIDRLTCEQVFRLLDDYLDKELTQEEMQRVREHLDTCAWCAAEYQFEAEVIQSMRARVQRIAVAPSLRAKVITALRRAQNDADQKGKA